MDEDGAGSPGSLALELLLDLPGGVVGVDGPREGDEGGAGSEFFAEEGDLLHDVAGVAGAAHEDDGAVAPVALRGEGLTVSKSSL